MSASSATGQLVFLPLIASLTDQLGWRLALVFVCGMLGLAALLAFALMRDRPSDLNLPPYGEREVVPAPPGRTLRSGQIGQALQSEPNMSAEGEQLAVAKAHAILNTLNPDAERPRHGGCDMAVWHRVRRRQCCRCAPLLNLVPNQRRNVRAADIFDGAESAVGWGQAEIRR